MGRRSKRGVVSDGDMPRSREAILAALARVAPAYTHAHVFVDSPDYYQMMKDLNLHIVDICVISRKDEPPNFRSC